MTRALPGVLAVLLLSAGAVPGTARAQELPPLTPAPFVPAQQDAPGAVLPDAPLSIEDALVIALANNPDVVRDAWEIEAAEARKRQASSTQRPSLGLVSAYRHHWHEERLVPARGQTVPASFSHDIFTGDLALTMPLFTGGRVANAIAAADLKARAAEQRFARTREELIFEVKSAFYAILGEDKLVQAIEHSRKAMSEHRQVMLQLIAARKAARVDLLNIEVRIADLDHRLVKQRGIVKLHERLFLSLLGVEQAMPDGLVLEGSLAPPKTVPDRVELLARAIGKRPDLAELDLEIEAQTRRVEMVEAESRPLVSARGTYGARLSAQGDYDDLGFVGLELALPIFDGGRTPARVREEQARLSILQQQKRKLLLLIRGEVDSAVIQVETARAAVEATERSIAMAEESLRITREKTALGHGTAADVLDAQAALLQTETTCFAALADLRTAYARLEYAAGGGTLIDNTSPEDNRR